MSIYARLFGLMELSQIQELGNICVTSMV